MSSRSISRWFIAAAAMVFYAIMIAVGRLPSFGNFNTAVVTGVMSELPATVTQVVVRSPSETFQFDLRGGHWQLKNAATWTEASAKVLQQAIDFMHTAAPVRTLDAPSLNPSFGLDPPLYSITLANTAGQLLQAEMGLKNPDGVLRYLRVAGEKRVYLMSGFVGEAWDNVLTAARNQSNP